MFGRSLRNTLIASACVLPVLSGMAGSALASKDNFVVRNNSNTPMTELYISESNRSTWDNNVLGADTLSRGGQTQVMFGDRNSSVCLYDIRAVFSNGQVVEDYQINVCRNSEYTFRDR
ncbi:MAG TPA: hypothetical protein V6C78_07975 [Crinalium sp.]|jgi:hypothetical protein